MLTLRGEPVAAAPSNVLIVKVVEAVRLVRKLPDVIEQTPDALVVQVPEPPVVNDPPTTTPEAAAPMSSKIVAVPVARQLFRPDVAEEPVKPVTVDPVGGSPPSHEAGTSKLSVI